MYEDFSTRELFDECRAILSEFNDAVKNNNTLEASNIVREGREANAEILQREDLPVRAKEMIEESSRTYRKFVRDNEAGRTNKNIKSPQSWSKPKPLLKILAWASGVFLIMAGIGGILSLSVLSGLLVMICGFVILPIFPLALKSISPSAARFIFGWKRVAVCVVALLLSMLFYSKTPQSSNQVSNGSNQTAAVAAIAATIEPKQTPKPTPTPTPTPKPTPTPTPEPTPTPSPTPRPTLNPDNYETFKCKNYERTPADYVGKALKFDGKILQVVDNDIGGIFKKTLGYSPVSYRIAKDGVYNAVIYVDYKLYDGDDRLLEDDVVDVYGIGQDLYSYNTVLGAELTIPHIEADFIVLSK